MRVFARILLQRIANFVPFDGLRASLYRASGIKIRLLETQLPTGA